MHSNGTLYTGQWIRFASRRVKREKARCSTAAPSLQVEVRCIRRQTQKLHDSTVDANAAVAVQSTPAILEELAGVDHHSGGPSSAVLGPDSNPIHAITRKIESMCGCGCHSEFQRQLATNALPSMFEQPSDDDDLDTERPSLRISSSTINLRCPLSRAPFNIPALLLKCGHQQPFDLPTVLHWSFRAALAPNDPPNWQDVPISFSPPGEVPVFVTGGGLARSAVGFEIRCPVCGEQGSLSEVRVPAAFTQLIMQGVVAGSETIGVCDVRRRALWNEAELRRAVDRLSVHCPQHIPIDD